MEHVRYRWGALNIGFVGHSISRAHRCVAGRSRVVMKRHLRSELLNWLTNYGRDGYWRVYALGT